MNPHRLTRVIWAACILWGPLADARTTVLADQPVEAGATNLQERVASADVIVVARFLSTENRRRSQAPIEPLQTLKGGLPPKTQVIACFKANALTIAPRKETTWIFFLLPPMQTEEGKQYRKTIGQHGAKAGLLNNDYEGILRATEENIKAVKALLDNERTGPPKERRP